MNNFRYALRQVVDHPGYAAAVVLTLALGIGATTAIISVANVTVLRPLPFPEDERLVRIYEVPASRQPRISPRAAVFQAVREQGRFFQGIVAQRLGSFTLQTTDGPERLVGVAVSAGWTTTLGVRPVMGRSFTPEEMSRGDEARVAVLSHGTWQRRFGGEPDVLDRTMRLDGHAYRVVGVMPPGFQYPYSAELWVPLRVDGPQVGPWGLNIQARLAPGVTLEATREELLAITRRAVAEVPGFVANLMLTRGLGRERELAIRAALGAGRRRLIGQLFAESLVLVPPGALAGVAIAHAATGLMAALVPRSLADDFAAAATIDPAGLLFAVATTIACTLAFGLAPAVQLSAGHAAEVLHASAARQTGGIRARRLTQALIVGQLGFALMLLSGAGLMWGELRARQLVDVGYPDEGLLTFSVSLERPLYGAPSVDPMVVL